VDERRQIREDLKEARKALGKKDYTTALDLARSAERDSCATTPQKKSAKAIAARVERAQGMMNPSYVSVEFVEHPEQEDTPAVWFHDTSVEPGKTYRYRMRVKLWNRYVGRMKSLRDAQDARKTVLVGDWSLPTGPVTVAPKKHFFVSGPRFDEPAARVDVFTWHNGDWLMETFSVRVGDVIGQLAETKTADFDEQGRAVRENVDFTTEAVVLDLRFDEPVLARRTTGKEGEFAYSERPSLVLVYLDPADGQVKERVDALDRNNITYRNLKDEYELMIE
jgi:hypothetical protein